MPVNESHQDMDLPLEGVRVLGGEIKTALTFEVAGASAPAVAAIEAAGGKVVVPAAAAKE